jgi:cytidylate kinase
MSFVITIDGPAAAGKSTTAREVAARLGFLYVDTGALYRALALKLQWQGGSPDEPASVKRLLAGTRLDLSGAPDQAHVWLDGEDVSGQIRTPDVSELSSRLAALPAVRRWLVGIQRGLRVRGPLVAEGRDLGTVVFPDAEVKIYLDAAPLVRAQRRARELEQRGLAAELERVLAEVQRRDERDRTRAESPLRPAAGAVVVESSDKDVEAVVEAVLSVVRAHPGCPGGAAGSPAHPAAPWLDVQPGPPGGPPPEPDPGPGREGDRGPGSDRAD